MKYRFKDLRPQIADSAYIAPDAVVIGDAIIKEEASIWFKTVIRADINSIEVGHQSNIQDTCILHVTREYPVLVGDRVTVGHGVTLHGCTVEDDCLIGIGAVVLDNARVGRGSLVAAGAVVAPGTVIPPESLVMGIPARVVRKLHQRDRKKFEANWRNYLELKDVYLSEDFELIEN
ncbi:MAG TPA: gamma carbonic anhydrase family protein [Candidatus Melainabacteria bacterium]|nr:gamma carbonic anhydrase family protein [Candidatus Melainabacteria bacterium]